ncbi:(2,3-dihydroxybenzoyl)adenylate synthase [Nocardia stercoris]|uniref:2,3-dihydroxybenzoate-AMP ligase n=1 Tax=Nocardia stercoris TaxID=2483361 RepID=A0A3M2KSC1_9NOCA|nr:AMP-binding protein [Nocardia stercoris]RMI28379.1 2,3-dihydroxybenzoate-AMP ligase [Nocardia stercoris]
MGSTSGDHRTGYVPFPAEDAERYRTAGYWAGRPLGDLLRSAAERWGTRPAIVGDQPLGYAELDHAADRMAAGLTAQGFEPGDRVLVQLPNGPEFVTVLFGLLRAGVIPVLALPAHRSAEIIHLARLSDAAGYVIADRAAGFDYRVLADELLAAVPAVRRVLVHGDPGPHTALAAVPCAPDGPLPQPDPGDIALMLVSGGTTGLPKLIARTHDDYHYNARASAELCELTESDVYLVSLPAAHNFPLACPGILGTVASGGALAFVADPSPETAFAAVERHGVTVTALVPPLAQLWCAATEWEEADLGSLRLLQVGGAKLAEPVAREVTPRLGARLQQVFGMAEGLLNYTRLDDPDDLIRTTQGRPLSPADRVRVVDPDGRDVPPGAEGELITQGPYTIRGYYRAAEHNARAFTPDGWYRSGDLVRRLPSGHLVVTGRAKDVINRGGENVSCDELEEHLLALPGVQHAAVVGLPDDALGEKVCAALVADPMPTLAAVRSFLTGRGLAAYKHPDQVRRIDVLPVTAVGKIDRRALTAALGALEV